DPAAQDQRNQLRQREAGGVQQDQGRPRAEPPGGHPGARVAATRDQGTKYQGPTTYLSGGKPGLPAPRKAGLCSASHPEGINQGEETWRNRIVALHRWTRKNRDRKSTRLNSSH